MDAWNRVLSNNNVLTDAYQLDAELRRYLPCKYVFVGSPGSEKATDILGKLDFSQIPNPQILRWIIDNPLAPYRLEKREPLTILGGERYAVFPTGYADAKSHGEIYQSMIFVGKWEAERHCSPHNPILWDSKEEAAMAQLHLFD